MASSYVIETKQQSGQWLRHNQAAIRSLGSAKTRANTDALICKAQKRVVNRKTEEVVYTTKETS